MNPRFFFVAMLSLFASGCSEGTKVSPLPRAGAPTLPAPLSGKTPVAKTLYERLGHEEGLTQTVNQLVKNLKADPKSEALAGKFKKSVLIDFLMEATSKPRPKLADDVMLSPADWVLLVPALRATLSAQGIPDADRDELLANIENSR